MKMIVFHKGRGRRSICRKTIAASGESVGFTQSVDMRRFIQLDSMRRVQSIVCVC